MFVAPHPVIASAPRAVPLPRRPLDPVDLDASGQVRRWYEDELGWPTVPGDPPRLAVGVRFDVLDVPAEAGHAALRRLGPGSPVAVRGDRMQLLVATGSAEELPGLLEWLEWGTLTLDLTAIGPGGQVDAPLPPGMDGRRLPEGGARPALEVDGRVLPDEGARMPAEVDARSLPGGGGQLLPDGISTRTHPDVGVRQLVGVDAPSPSGVDARSASGTDAPLSCEPGPFAGRPLPLGRLGSQGAAVWLRPPEPGCEVETSLPTLSALGSGGGAPDLVRLVDTVATQCHRIRLRRACAQPPALRAQGR
ncbi:SCO3374 family protein [Streptomyces lomondensis]|uniref:Proline-rich protein n=1 Tax=Streptomyces lomondensis TaxID=68229 RepID=A0ABQ2XDU4_9ACTN|nr:SCO3374 family protein [Streptomyces lomondensis]MCF0077863.1 SCO3374 family protein [Streptomyces lomondensis]GGX11880.1 hypothetical protein GCM10010383_47220 [Streptomyces lomondensis]